MQSESPKLTRSQQSRINGAKSRGPKTPHGLERAQIASTTHGLYAKNPSLRPTVDDTAYAALRQNYQSVWNPSNTYLADKIEDIVAIRWELNRLREVRRQYLAQIFNDVAATCANLPETSAVTETEKRANTQSGTLDRFDLRIRRCHLEISRAERDFIRAHRFFSASGPSQNPLETNEQNPIEWAEDTFDLALDPHQADILTTQAPLTVCNAARYSGKTTALALRALHQSLRHPQQQIACLSPNGALLNKVNELAAITNQPVANISGTYTKEASLILIDDASEIKNSPEFTPGTQIIIAGTPKGAAGYFYDHCRNPEAVLIHAPAASCDTIPDGVMEMALNLAKPAYQQEFECAFLEEAQPRCRLLPLTQ